MDVTKSELVVTHYDQIKSLPWVGCAAFDMGNFKACDTYMVLPTTTLDDVCHAMYEMSVHGMGIDDPVTEDMARHYLDRLKATKDLDIYSMSEEDKQALFAQEAIDDVRDMSLDQIIDLVNSDNQGIAFSVVLETDCDFHTITLDDQKISSIYSIPTSFDFNAHMMQSLKDDVELSIVDSFLIAVLNNGTILDSILK